MSRTDGRRPAGRIWLVASLAMLMLVLAACSAGTGALPAPEQQGVEANGTGGDGSAARAVDETGGGPAAAEPGGFFAPADRDIIKTGEVTLEVANVADALGRVRAAARELGGYVGGSQAGTLEQSATLTLRVPADRFDDALARLHELDATVVTEATREEDVTGQVVDLEARIANLEASEISYRTLLERAERFDDVLAVQTRLDQVRGEIEQLKGQLKSLSGQADLATLTVTLTPKPEPIEAQTATWDPGGELNTAIASLVGFAQGVAGALIWFAVVWVPILLVLGIVALLALRGVLEVRRRVPAIAADRPPQ